jgi:hypothetical protein
MRCYFIALVLPTLLLLTSPASADPQWPRPVPTPPRSSWRGDVLPGAYVNQSAGGYCYVYRRGASYLLYNEHGSPARFAYTAPGQLAMISGEWDPATVITVQQDASGRTLLRFDAPYTPTGYWVSAN